MLTAMARELVTQKGVGEKADALWKEIQQQHTRLLGTTSVVMEQQQNGLGEAGPPENEPLCPLQPELAPAGLVQLALSRQRIAPRPRPESDAQLSLAF
jgi:hypothetical protein